MSAELRMSLVYALTNPEEFSNEVNQVEMRSSEPTYAECLALITFTDDYLQPGLIKHNRPLFISGYLNGLEITRIMIDGGSAVNLLPLRMLKRLGIAIHRLAPSNLLIQGFHQSRQRSLGIVRLELKIEELLSIDGFPIGRHLMMMNFLYQRRRTIFVPRLCSPGKRRLDYESHGSRL